MKYDRKAPQEPPYTYLDQDSAYRVRYRSNHSELRPRRASKPLRTGKSEMHERNLKLHPVEIPLEPPVPVHNNNNNNEITPTPADPLSEREAKRKEIQSLIMKYSALDEVYNRGVNGTGTVVTSGGVVGGGKKYHPAAARYVAVVSNGVWRVIIE